MTSHPPREEELFARPSPDDIRTGWTELFSDPLLSLSKLRSTALSKPGLGQSSPDGGIILRSVCWRFYHGLLPHPTSLHIFPPNLSSSRSAYASLRRRYLVAPDGRWAADCSGGNEHDPSTHAGPSSSTPRGEWDPLSLDGSSPWKAWFAHLELRNTIRQDVERTFPDIPYFGLERVRRLLVTMLFLFAVLNPDVGYRQGMHELLAVCCLVVDRDSLEAPTSDPSAGPLSVSTEKSRMREAMTATLDRRYVEHDAFGLFQEVMKGAKPFYEWRAEEGPKTKNSAALPAPIITRCNHIHDSLIRRIDPQLWERLETEGVEPQIWAIRWLRLIFTRELPFPLAMRIWDGVFAEDPGLGILDFVCIAMLLLIRNELLDADYPTLLTHLLHFPAPSTTYPISPTVILSQAQFLRDNISPASGVQVVIQNQEMLGVRAQPPEREETAPMRGRGGPPRSSNNRGKMAGPSGSHGMQGMQGLAAGLFERAQAAGLDKAILSTVADLRKNLPDSATAYSYLPNPFSPVQSPAAREAAAPFSSIPTSASFSYRPPHLSPPPTASFRPSILPRASADSNISIKSVRDAEREAAELRLSMVGMGKAMSEWLILLSEYSGKSPQQASALKGLERIRDTLLDAAVKEVDEIVKEWGWHEGLETSRSRGSTPLTATSSTSAPIASSAPTDMPTLPRDEVVFDAGEVTPTTPSFPALPLIPSMPVPPSLQRAPMQNQVSGSQPPMHLAARDDKPSATLPRIPLAAPPRPHPHNFSPSWPARTVSTATDVDGVIATRQEDEEVKANGDPLAGLGVTAAKADGARRGPVSGKRGDPVVDPLLGVGVR